MSLITAPISISASTCCLPGTRVCGIPLGKLLKQLLVSICALKRVCKCVSWCGLTSPLQQQCGLSAQRADDSLSFLESLKSLMLWRKGQTEKGQPKPNAAAEIFLFSSYFSILLRAHLICVSRICMCVCVCVFCCQLYLFSLSRHSDILPSLDTLLKRDQYDQYNSLFQSLLVI